MSMRSQCVGSGEHKQVTLGTEQAGSLSKEDAPF